jgi:hypothetical protein
MTSGWKERERMAAACFAAALLMASCFGPQSRVKCYAQSDCPNGQVCSAAGFCTHECEKDRDCPCGAACATSCGLCLFVANAAPATCFSHDRGLTAADVQGACRDFMTAPETPASAGCAPVELACPIFVPQPSEDAVRDAGAPDGDAAADDDAATDDGAVDDGGDTDDGGGQ